MAIEEWTLEKRLPVNRFWVAKSIKPREILWKMLNHVKRDLWILQIYTFGFFKFAPQVWASEADHFLRLTDSTAICSEISELTVKNHFYFYKLEHKGKADIRSKCPGLSTKGILLEHDNTSPPAYQFTRDKLPELGWECFRLPAYNPNLALPLLIRRK